MQIPFFVRYHPVLALRYLPMVKVIKKLKPQTVVEIGSGGLGIGPYLKSHFYGIDISFSPPLSTFITPIVGSGLSIPLKSRAADVVISSDVLEHIDPNMRPTAVCELFRISQKCLIIGVPVGQKSSLLDRELDREYIKKHGESHPFLTEHTKYGLPDYSDVISMIGSAAKKMKRQITITSIPNQNLILRKFLLKGWISTNLLVNIFFRKILLLAIPVMRLLNHPPVYRHIFFIKFED